MPLFYVHFKVKIPPGSFSLLLKGLTFSSVEKYIFNMQVYLMFIDRVTIGMILLYVPVTRFNIIILHAILVFISRH